ncbi:MAG: hypothetical protein ACOYL6_14740 [Bacteriovoracaceae bacterium]
MKGFGIIALLVSLIIVGILVAKKNKTTVKVNPVKEVEIQKLPEAINVELENVNKMKEQQLEDGKAEE